jgi:alkanesulfonate monooxygenase SsuD/methylene tetrahydromethanopterin reductase-like flavin-dependent oxidoreductase (luciferase family)
MKFGLFLNGQRLPSEGPMSTRIQEALEQTRAARDAGFDIVGAGQHFLSAPYQMPAIYPFLARVAADAGKMNLCSAITLVPLHNPVYLAETVATLDAICDGRFIFGIGLGYRDEEFVAFGVKREEIAPRLREGLEVMKLLWTGEEVEYQGKYYQLPKVRLATQPIQKPYPPIWVAANNHGAIRRAARLGLAWLINPHATVTTIAEQMEMYQQTLKESGKPAPPDLPMMRELYIAKDMEMAYSQSSPYLASKYQVYAKWGQDKALPGQENFQVPFEDLAKDRFLVGNPQHVIEEIRRYQETLGVTHMFFRMQWPGMPHANVMKEIEIMGSQVIPALKK